MTDDKHPYGNPKPKSNFKFIGSVFILLALAFVFIALFFPVYIGSNLSTKTSCLMNMKQLSLCSLIYSGDNDDNLPPYFTFEGPTQEKAFTDVIWPYSKNKNILFCPEIVEHSGRSREVKALEGDATTMGYVHSISLEGIIPNYSKGARVLNVGSKVQNVATTPYLRDPLATRSNKESEDSPFYSPHGPGFVTGFLDGHAKVVKIGQGGSL